MIKDRGIGFHEIRGYMCRRVKIAFSNRLYERGFNGVLNFDHHNKDEKSGENKPLLSLMVDPQGGQTVKRRDMKTLSGGEKSFSTVIYLFLLLILYTQCKHKRNIISS